MKDNKKLLILLSLNLIFASLAFPVSHHYDKFSKYPNGEVDVSEDSEVFVAFANNFDYLEINKDGEWKKVIDNMGNTEKIEQGEFKVRMVNEYNGHYLVNNVENIEID